MEKKSNAQQKLEARKQIKESFEKIEPYVMPNMSKDERQEVMESAVSSVVKRDVFGRKYSNVDTQYKRETLRYLQRKEDELVERIKRSLYTCDEQFLSLGKPVAIDEIEGEILLILDKEMESKINATKVSIEELKALDEKLQSQIKKNEDELSSNLGL